MARDLGCSIALLAVAVGYYLAASGLGRSALADEVGPAGLPMVYAVVLAVVALMLALQAVLRVVLQRAQAKTLAERPDLGFMLRRAGGVFGIGVGYLLIVPVVGYLIALILVLAVMLIYMGERPSARVAVAAIGGAALFWAFFDRLLGIPMPGIWGL